MAALTFYLPCSAGLCSALSCLMDSLFLFMLLLGGAPEGSSIDAPSHVQVTASARILRGETIDFEKPITRLGANAGIGSGAIFQLAPLRSTGELISVDHSKIQLQEFH
ncbi:MAG: hypothetical protein ABJF89_03145 [Parasphingorhabdus sp.]|uniref:hypothetical protein n=2 Tax=Parasphingorhabdus sp. TaxID=2709688 RepID=UPI0032675BFB